MSPEERAAFLAQVTQIPKYPDFKGPISVEDSVGKQLEVIDRWTLDRSGAFVSHKGNKEWI